MSIAPSSDNYTLGRGRLAFNRVVNGTPAGLRDLGNAIDFNLSVSSEKKDHFSSRKGIKVKDKSVVVSMTVTGSFTLDEIMPDNLALTLLASVTKVTQTAAQNKTKTFTTASKKGHYLQLDDYFVDETPANFSLTVSAAAKTNGVDYVLDGKSGQIFIPATSTIADASTCVVEYDTLAKTFYKLNAFDENAIEGELHFIGDPAVGNPIQARMWKVTLAPSGDFGLISDDWSNLKFEVELGSDETNHPLFPYMEVIMAE